MMHYKFLDVGCKLGGSFFSISKKYKYLPTEGIGIDINANHVNEFIKTGNHAIIASASDIPFKDNSFELVIFNHVLEHMPDEKTGFDALNECIRVSSKVVFLSLPFFDEDEYLKSLKLKTFYSDWTGHKNKVHLKKILDFLKDRKTEVTMKKEIKNSFSEEILPLVAPRNSMAYNQEIHGIKEYVEFNKEIWREYKIIIKK
jgi:ubiquinone/menaquinone biosynthesis C-methylase UbiE